MRNNRILAVMLLYFELVMDSLNHLVAILFLI